MTGRKEKEKMEHVKENRQNTEEPDFRTALGIKIVDRGAGWARGEMKAEKLHLNPLGIIPWGLPLFTGRHGVRHRHYGIWLPGDDSKRQHPVFKTWKAGGHDHGRGQDGKAWKDVFRL